MDINSIVILTTMTPLKIMITVIIHCVMKNIRTLSCTELFLIKIVINLNIKILKV